MFRNIFLKALFTVFLLNITLPAYSDQQAAIQGQVDAEKDAVAAAQKAAESAKSSDNSIKENADKSSMLNYLSAAAQAAAGGFMIYTGKQVLATCGGTGGTSCAPGYMMMAMGGISLAQSAASLATQKESDRVASATNAGLDTGESGKPSLNQLYDSTTSKIVTSQLGGSLDPGGVFQNRVGKITLPNGKSLDTSKSLTAADFKAAGFSDKDISDAVGKYKDSLDKYQKMVNENAGMALSGGGGGSSVTYVDEEYDPNAGLGSGAKVGDKSSLARDPANLAGMQKNYNGEPIGVAADSIFLMMSRRYKVKDTQDSFYNEVEMPVVKRTSK